MHTHFWWYIHVQMPVHTKSYNHTKKTIQLLHWYKSSKQRGSSKWDTQESYLQRSPIDKIFEYFQTLQKWVWEICSSMFLWKGHFWAKWFSVYLAVAERKNISNVYFLSLEDEDDKLCWIRKHEIKCKNFLKKKNMFISIFAGANWQLTSRACLAVRFTAKNGDTPGAGKNWENWIFTGKMGHWGHKNAQIGKETCQLSCGTCQIFLFTVVAMGVTFIKVILNLPKNVLTSNFRIYPGA